MKHELPHSSCLKRECAVIVSALVLFAVLFAPYLFTHKRMFAHDTIWFYGLAHYFFDSLTRGIWPLWDPYGYCGQPMYYALGLLRLYEPLPLALVFLAKPFKISLLTIYHWEYISRIVVYAAGTYLCFRRSVRYPESRAVILFVALFSSLAFASLRQNGILLAVYWTPWILYFLKRLLDNPSIINWVGLGLFSGLSAANYQVVYVAVFMNIFVLTLLINRRGALAKVLFGRFSFLKLIAFAVISFNLILPSLAVYLEKDRNVPIHRLLHKSDDEIKSLIGSGKDLFSIPSPGEPSTVNDFLGLIIPSAAPDFYKKLFPQPEKRIFSEAFLYIGIMPLAFAVLGIIRGRHHYKINYLVTLALIALLMLGLGYRYLFFLQVFCPFLTMARHAQLFGGFFIFTLTYFAGLGADSFRDIARSADREENSEHAF